MTDRCQKTIEVGGNKAQCDLEADHRGMCGFVFDKGSAHFTDRALSDKELRDLSAGRLDPADVLVPDSQDSDSGKQG